MKLAEIVTFGGSALDRAAMDRSAADHHWQHSETRVMVVWRGKPLMHGDQLAWLTQTHSLAQSAKEKVFLGRDETGTCLFAIDVSAWEPPDDSPAQLDSFSDPTVQVHPDLSSDFGFTELRSVMFGLSAREAELAATARAVLGWHRSHRFCSACGAQSLAAMGGWQRDCPECQTRHFPRTDPVVIMLITRGNSVLVGRSPGWPEGMYSLLAGFVEPGETVEAAVRREVHEEAGIHVGAVTYLASQPWPFPASLMLGCHGAALSSEITLDPAELEDALWISREELADVFAGQHMKILPPRKGAIAGFLLEHWLADLLD